MARFFSQKIAQKMLIFYVNSAAIDDFPTKMMKNQHFDEAARLRIEGTKKQPASFETGCGKQDVVFT